MLIQLSKTSDAAIALSLYSVSAFFLERIQHLGHRKWGILVVTRMWRKCEILARRSYLRNL